MGMYTGVQIDLRLKKELPPQIAVWLSKHTLGEGDIADMNSMFTGGVVYFDNWKGGSLRFVEGDPQYGDYWHLKVNGCWKHDKNKLAFFLHEIYPWTDMRVDEVMARTIFEESEVREYIYWVDPDDTLVRCRQGNAYTYETEHPRKWDTEDLAKPLGLEKDYPRKEWCDLQVFNFRANDVVSPNQEEKRILARQHNERYQSNALAELEEQIKAMEGK